jgi:hypothetical protein
MSVDRITLHSQLDALIDRAAFLRAQIADETGQTAVERYEVEAHLAARDGLNLIARALGGEVHALAVRAGHPEGALGSLPYWLRLASSFFDPLGVTDPSVADLVWELGAVSRGDPPRLLAARDGQKGKRRNTYRRLNHQLDAVAWEAVLKRLAIDSGEAQTLIATAFGGEWDTIRKWKKACEVGLGTQTVQRVIYWAVAAARDWEGRPLDELVHQLNEDGARWLAEEAANAQK